MSPQGLDYWKKRPLDDPKRDWDADAENWVHDYAESLKHPHRDKLVEIIGDLLPETESLLEIGASCGPNLIRLHEAFPKLALTGIEPSIAANYAHELDILPGTVTDLPFEDKTFDCVLCDAVLMYVGPDEIKQAFDEIDRVARESIVLVEWQGKSIRGEINNFHWSRDYRYILKWYGFSVAIVKITKKIWPTKTWYENGYIFVARRL